MPPGKAADGARRPVRKRAGAVRKEVACLLKARDGAGSSVPVPRPWPSRPWSPSWWPGPRWRAIREVVPAGEQLRDRHGREPEGRRRRAVASTGRDVTEIRKADTPSGADRRVVRPGRQGGHAAVPTVVDGSIPPNKSDLKFFGVYQEGTGGSGFLNLYWSRVQEPSGTTNMDFEFNKRQCTPVDTGGSRLHVERPHADPQRGRPADPVRPGGGRHAPGAVPLELADHRRGLAVRGRELDAVLGDRVNLSDAGDAAGSINTSAIPAADSDGLGAHSARTFGEAQLDLSAIFDPNVCESFGSAYLKSRSSDSFTAAMKDFVPPGAGQHRQLRQPQRQEVHRRRRGRRRRRRRRRSRPTSRAGASPSSKVGGGFSCTGTTDATGALTGCAGLSTLAAGTYTVTENANAGRTIGTNPAPFFNTDPGSDGINGSTTPVAPAAAPPVSETVAVAVSGNATVDFGNSCYATASFSVTGVPAGTTGLFVATRSTAARRRRPLTGTTATRTASVGGLRRGDAITWEVRSTQVTRRDPRAAGSASSGYPSCAGSGSAAFQAGDRHRVEVQGPRRERRPRRRPTAAIGGFEFTLGGQTATSDASGVDHVLERRPGHVHDRRGRTAHRVAADRAREQRDALGDGAARRHERPGGRVRQHAAVEDRRRIHVAGESARDGRRTRRTRAPITCTSGGAERRDLGLRQQQDGDDLLLTKSPVTCVITFEDP